MAALQLESTRSKLIKCCIKTVKNLITNLRFELRLDFGINTELHVLIELALVMIWESVRAYVDTVSSDWFDSS